jgi:hypothetical protein
MKLIAESYYNNHHFYFIFAGHAIELILKVNVDGGGHLSSILQININ